MLNHFLAATLLLLSVGYSSGSSGLLGYWREPSGSVIGIAPCGREVCATLLAISPDAPEITDKMIPQQTLRRRPLCGLVIGKGFRLQGDNHAEGGTLYDPKSGKTYHGEMTVEGDTLSLRGYVGLRLFGRTETWTRTATPPPCAAA